MLLDKWAFGPMGLISDDSGFGIIGCRKNCMALNFLLAKSDCEIYFDCVNFDQVVVSSIAKCSLVQLLRGKDADHYMQKVYSVPHSLCTAFVRTVLRIWTTCALKIANVSSDM